MIIDVNVNYGLWPFRRFPVNSLRKLEKNLRNNKINLSFISHLGGVLNFQEVDEFNKELYRKIKNKRIFYFVPIVNLRLADAEEKIGESKFIKIVPTYHYYSINDKKFSSIFKKISDLKISLFIQMRYEDERSHNPAFKIKGMDVEEIKKFALDFPEIKIIILCGYFREVIEVCKIENVYSDISFVESYKTLKSLLKEIPADKILFGSHAPFLYVESQIAKLTYSEIGKEDLEKISSKNILSFFDRGMSLL